MNSLPLCFILRRPFFSSNRQYSFAAHRVLSYLNIDIEYPLSVRAEQQTFAATEISSRF